jgi:D-3-phosphoglycerate dehydrogenase
MSKKNKYVIITDEISDEHLAKLKGLYTGYEVLKLYGDKENYPDCINSVSPEILANTEKLVVRSSKITSEIISHLPKDSIITRAGSGVDNIDLNAANEHGIIVQNTPFCNSNAVAELNMASLNVICAVNGISENITTKVAQERRIIDCDNEIKIGKKPDKTLYRAEEKLQDFLNLNASDNGIKVGIVGFGSIGQQTAIYAKKLGYDVSVSNKSDCQDLASELGLKYISQAAQNEIFKNSDVIIIGVDGDKNILTDEAIEAMKQGGGGKKVINTARLRCVDIDKLEKAFDNGAISSYVFDGKGYEELKKLIDKRPEFKDKIILTAHIGSETNQGQDKIIDRIISQENAIKSGLVLDAVNDINNDSKYSKKTNADSLLRHYKKIPYEVYGLNDKQKKYSEEHINILEKFARSTLIAAGNGINENELNSYFTELFNDKNKFGEVYKKALELSELRTDWKMGR